ncbi:hypothetical protein GS909_18275 [Rhodococcus hoagii]|nr:hypothetical protein [Prescottella equi]
MTSASRATCTEIEFFLLENGPIDGSPTGPRGQRRLLRPGRARSGTELPSHAIDALESMGISVEFSHHEAAPGQQEIDLRYADALSMADNVMTFRYVVKEVAIDEGVRASFMPKPFGDQAGSAMHTHMSLFEGDTNAFHNPDDPNQLSATGKAFIAGISSTPTRSVPSQPVGELLQSGCPRRRGADGRDMGPVQPVRADPRADVHAEQRRRRGASRVRSPDSACNPYLDVRRPARRRTARHREGLRAAARAEDDVWALTGAERRAMGYKPLPGSLAEALAEMEKSELVAEALGEHVFDFFLRKSDAMGGVPQPGLLRAEGLPRL